MKANMLNAIEIRIAREASPAILDVGYYMMEN